MVGLKRLWALSFVLFSFHIVYAGVEDCQRVLGVTHGLQPGSDLLTPAIKEAILQRTAPLRETPARPYLLDSSGNPVNVLTGMEQEFASLVLLGSRDAIKTFISNLIKAWLQASIEEFKETPFEEKTQILSGDYVGSVAVDDAGVPLLRVFQDHYSISKQLIADHWSNMEKERKKKGGTNTGRQNLRNKEISDLARRVLERSLKEVESNFHQRIEEVTEPRIDQVELALTQQMEKVTSPQDNAGWKYAIVRSTIELVRQMIDELNRNYPLTHLRQNRTVDEIPALKLAQQIQASELPPGITELVPTAIMNQDIPELIFPQSGIGVYYDKEVGTTRIVLSKKPPRKALVLVPVHGAGTVRSNVKSWEALAYTLVQDGFAPFPPDMPYAGMGMPIKGLKETTAYLDVYMRHVRAENPKQENMPLIPLGILGRSMGAIQAMMHGILHGGSEDVVDYRVVMSTSIPYTSKQQIKNLYQQKRDGVLQGMYPVSLGAAHWYQREAAKELDTLVDSNPHAFSNFGDGILFMNGNDDEDGGPTVMKDTRNFLSRFAPLGHLYVFENPLLRYELPYHNKVSTEMQEGKHFLLSIRQNIETKEQWESFLKLQKKGGMTEKEWEEFYAAAKDIPSEAWPKLRDQYIEFMAVFWGYLDRLADSHSKDPGVKRSKAVIGPYREFITGSKTFFEWYCEKKRVSKQDLSVATAGRASMVQRLKRVEQYWIEENRRVDQKLRELRLFESTTP